MELNYVSKFVTSDGRLYPKENSACALHICDGHYKIDFALAIAETQKRELK